MRQSEPAVLRTDQPRRVLIAASVPASSAVGKVVQAFNTWAFKRERTSDPLLMEQVVAAAIAGSTPLQFVLYWGKGPRSRIDVPENACLDYLFSMASRIEAVYPPGARFTLILTDTHAELNGHTRAEVDRYFSEVAQAAVQRGMSTVKLTELVGKAPDVPVDHAAEPDAEILEKLSSCAAKWFRGEGSPACGARRYYKMNMVERRAVELAFPQAIFATFNGSEYRQLFPAGMPVFYMYSLKKGTAVKPWFVGVGTAANDEMDRAALCTNSG